MDILALQNLESQGAHAQIERQLNEALKQSPHLSLLQYASAYYARRGKPGKSLNIYSAYIQQTMPGHRDLEAVQMAIDWARRIQDHKLVREFFLSLSTTEREMLASASLMHIAAAFINLAQLDEAEKVLRFVRKKSGTKQLVTFDELITSRFGSLDEAKAYAATTQPRFDRGDFYAKVKQAVNLALAHMSQGNFSTAENILQSCKAEVAA
jgi:tetratricopeptide (TPR) repeat protein